MYTGVTITPDSLYLQSQTNQVPKHILSAACSSTRLHIRRVGIQRVAIIEHLRSIRSLVYRQLPGQSHRTGNGHHSLRSQYRRPVVSTLTRAGSFVHGVSPVVIHRKAFIRHEYIHLIAVNGGHSCVNERGHISTHSRSDSNTSHHVTVVVIVHIAIVVCVHLACGRGCRIHHPSISFVIHGVLVVHALVLSIRRFSLHSSFTTRYQQDGQ